MSGVRQALPIAPGPGQVAEVATGISWARIPLPYVPDYVNSYIIDGDDGYLIVDTGLDSEDARECWRALLTGPLRDRRVSRVFVTHWHNDHSGLAGWLAETTGATVLISELEREAVTGILSMSPELRDAREVQFLVSYGFEGELLEEWIADGFQHLSRISPLPSECLGLEGAQPLTYGDRQFEVVEMQGHTAASMGLFDSRANIFLAADQLSNSFIPSVGALSDSGTRDPLGEYVDSLRGINNRLDRDTLVLPGHEEPFFGVQESISRIARYHLKICDRILTATHAVGLSPYEFIQHVTKAPLEPVWSGFVVSRMIAYARLLTAKGLLEETQYGGVFRYRAAEKRVTSAMQIFTDLIID